MRSGDGAGGRRRDPSRAAWTIYMRNPETIHTAFRRRLLGRAARAIGAPVDWQAVHATETDAHPEPGPPPTTRRD